MVVVIYKTNYTFMAKRLRYAQIEDLTKMHLKETVFAGMTFHRTLI